ncbi:hypothetical protein D3C81_1262890 [compost metagenome]
MLLLCLHIQVLLNRVTVIIQHKNNRVTAICQHRADLLYCQLQRTVPGEEKHSAAWRGNAGAKGCRRSISYALPARLSDIIRTLRQSHLGDPVHERSRLGQGNIPFLQHPLNPWIISVGYQEILRGAGYCILLIRKGDARQRLSLLKAGLHQFTQHILRLNIHIYGFSDLDGLWLNINCSHKIKLGGEIRCIAV